jgi:hypothetical protein
MFFAGLGLHRLKTQFSPDIDGGNSETTVDLSLGPDSTILVLGSNTNTVPLAISPADGNLIVSIVETAVPLTLQV